MVIADAAAVQSHPQGVLTALTTWHDHSMERRDLIIGVTLAAVAAHNARAQPPTRKYRLAIFHPATPIASMVETGPSHYAALFGELRRLGYIEEGNLVVERFSGEGRPETYGEVAREIVRIAPDVIFPVSNRLVRHLQSHTRKIPIVATGLFSAAASAFALMMNSERLGRIRHSSASSGSEYCGGALPTAFRIFG
jgi:hypothetical protein